MPYSSLKTVPPGMKSVAPQTGAKAITLTLAQVKELAAIYDKLKGNPKIDNAMAVAKATFRKSHQVKNGKWVKRAMEESGEEETNVKEKTEEEKKAAKLEAYLDVKIDGGLRGELQKMEGQLRPAATASGQFGETKEDWDLDLMEIVGSQVYIHNTKISKYYRADYKIEDDQVTFSNVTEVIMKVVPIPLSEEGNKGATKHVFEEVPKKETKKKPPEPGDFVMEEKVSSESDKTEYTLSGKVLLEEAREDGDADLFKAKGSVPMIKEGVYTTNKNRYMRECVDWLETDIKRLQESKTSGEVLDMYPTHAPVTKPEINNPLLNKAGKITGLKRDGGVASICFETIATSAGQDMAVLLNEEMVDGVSLRAFPVEVKLNQRGGDDVYRMRLFGADFTDHGGMPFEEGDNARFTLEEKKGDGEMTIKEIKANKEIMATLREEFKAAEKGSEEQKALEIKLKAGEEALVKLEEVEREKRKTELLEAAGEKLKEEAEVLSEDRRSLMKDEVGARMEEILAADDPKVKMEEIVTAKIKVEKNLAGKNRADATKGLFANVSPLKLEDRRLGLLKEETGGSAKLSDILCAKVLQKSVITKEGRNIFEEFDWLLDPILERQKWYLGNQMNMESQEAFAPRGVIGSMLMEAEQQTTAITVPDGVPYEVASAILRIAEVQLIATRIANTGVMKSPTHKFWEETYRRYDDTTWGTYAYGGSFTGSAAAITYAQDAYLKVTTVIGGSALLATAITGTNQAGTAITGTCTVPTTASVGDYIAIVPANIGDKWTDISAATMAGWTSGAVSFVTGLPLTGSEASSFPKAQTTLAEVDVSAESYELGSALSNDAIEDMRMAMKDSGGGYDVMGSLVGLIAKDILTSIDGKILWLAADGASGATETFAQSTVPAGYTQTEWNATVERSINDMVGKVEVASNVGPSWLVINTMDRGRFVDWLGDRLFKYNIARDDAFQRSRAIGNIAGCEVYVTSQQPRSTWTCGNSQIGLHYLIYVALQLLGPQWDPTTNTHAILRRQRSGIKVTQPKTLGTLTIS